MKKILILFCLIPFALFGQNTYVRTQVDGTNAVLRRASDTLNPYVPYANRSALTITTDGGIIRFYENGVELRVMAYSPIYETNYYVKNGGDDTKSGLTDEDAWAHHPWMSTWTGSTVLVAGDVVNMKRGDTWSISSPAAPYMTVAQSGSAGKPITTTAYGTGADPIIKIATATDQPVVYADAKAYITFDNLHIQHHSSTYAIAASFDVCRSGFFLDGSNNPCHDFIFTNNEIDDIPYQAIHAYQDAYNITIGELDVATTATTTAYSNNIHDFGYAGVGLEGVDPISGESNFNVYYNYIHDGTRTGLVDIYGIYFSAVFTSSGWPVNATARFNRISNIDVHEGIDMHGGSYIYIQDNYIYNCLTGILAYSDYNASLPTPVADYVYIERNIIEQVNNPNGGVTFINMTGYNTTYRVTNSFITDNILYFTSRPGAGQEGAIAILTYNVENITTSDNTIYNGPTVELTYGGITSATNTNYSKDLIVKNNSVFNWGAAIYTDGRGVDGDISFYSNVVKSSDEAFIWTDQIDYDVYVYNNTFLVSSAIDDHYVIACNGASTVINAGASLIIKNNIIGYTPTDANGWYVLTPNTITGTFECDYNQYWNSSRSDPFLYLNTARTWAYWTGTAGLEANSPNVAHGDSNFDPLFTNGSAGYTLIGDFALGAGSPAINAGLNTGVTTDYYGNPRVGNYDIGAIEVQ